MSSFGGGHVQAEGRHSSLLVLPCPGVSWSARCTPFSLVSHVLSGTLTCLVITDQPPLLSRQLLSDCFTSLNPTLCSVYPGTRALALFIVLFARLCFLSAYAFDGLDFTLALTWTHVFASNNFRDNTVRALKAIGIWVFSLPTGAS